MIDRHRKREGMKPLEALEYGRGKRLKGLDEFPTSDSTASRKKTDCWKKVILAPFMVAGVLIGTLIIIWFIDILFDAGVVDWFASLEAPYQGMWMAILT